MQAVVTRLALLFAGGGVPDVQLVEGGAGELLAAGAERDDRELRLRHRLQGDHAARGEVEHADVMAGRERQQLAIRTEPGDAIPLNQKSVKRFERVDLPKDELAGRTDRDR